ncbi:hypothetical protein CY34DRAFT_807594 [Suillus luteus UH-Slu-Lm8-n1]|uniref:Uncharacterized protein n=1 Tax=Suillus luteus UH-Slu-Lm8-n1 TaxID=930992 RepID=A0A0C9ZQT4_9AGAM|nr:hypothetical protein CY34DRAFT_807594 [Suillus luteus UH-Slu-Lm8-n1]
MISELDHAIANVRALSQVLFAPLPTFECGARRCVETHGNEISTTRVLAFGACSRAERS